MDDRQSFQVTINPAHCWGRKVGEDSGVGACRLCVEICPEVFEKPIVNFGAFVRPDADLASHRDKIGLAALDCPVEAIVVTSS